ncbi:DUF2156 domain-containing protein [Candidatus Woesearchaeota archaeon]|nr:DUF2156 domain-containing protein [Candidatus Woesearchaeota archaeon]
MELLELENNKELLLESINKFGYFPEHHYHHLIDLKEDGAKSILVKFDNSQCLFTFHYPESKTWWIVSEPLAQGDKQVEMITAFLNHVFNEGAEKVMCEFTNTFRSKVIKQITGKLIARQPAYSLFWPIFEMKNWDHTLAGKKWKIIRNLRNYFLREYEPEIITDIKTVSKEELNKLITKWIKTRHATDMVEDEQYYNMIKHEFEGFGQVRLFAVNGKPVSITAGWKIPNSNNYYSAVGILDYDYKGIGEATNVDDLIELKKQGYEFVDFGGSNGGLFDFKLKFQPHFFYRTDFFNIVKQKEI